jgi:preprotein translocase subunit SecD
VTSSQKQRALFVGGVILAAVLILIPTFFRSAVPEQWRSKSIKLGLDIRGGSYFVFTVQTIKAELRKKKLGLLRARVSGDRQVELVILGEEGADPVKSFVRKEYPQLINEQVTKIDGNTRITYEINPREAAQIEVDSVGQAIETIRNRVDGFGVAESSIQRSGEKQIIVQLPDITDVDRVKESIGSVAKLEFRLVADPTKATDTVTVRDREEGQNKLEDEVLMTGDAIKQARVDIDPQTGEVGVGLDFNPLGAKRFEQVTSENVGRRLAIVLDGVVQSSPRINERIGGGSAQITGAFSPEEAHRLAVVLRSGALPAPLTFEEGRSVGATLGADSIRSGVIASLAGTALVGVFIILYYRKCGVQAVLCVLLNGILILALLALFGATLTLPGIAGLALTIGMAIDANVLIFERIREELRAGASISTAIETGFHRVHWTIMDSNLTTLLAGVVLYIFGTGPIKGFAVTLSIGIATTIFTALVVSKLIFELVSFKDAKGNLSI